VTSAGANRATEKGEVFQVNSKEKKREEKGFKLTVNLLVKKERRVSS
jgi:hypothetical protein